MARLDLRPIALATLVALAGTPAGSPAEAQTTPPASTTGLYAGATPSFPIPSPAWSCTTQAQDAAWLGGDGANMCPLLTTNKRSFWSFCDVSIGPSNAQNRNQATHNVAIGNSIAIADCSNGSFNLTHFYRGTVASPLPFFADPDNPNDVQTGPTASRIWPRKALLDPNDGGMYVFGQQNSPSGSISNTFIFRVQNPTLVPWKWTMDYVSINHNASPGISYGTDGYLDTDGFLYTYGVYTPYPNSPDQFLSSFQVFPYRLPINALATAPAGSDIGSYGQYKASNGSWTSGAFNPSNYWHVNIDSSIGFSTRYNPTLQQATSKGWQAVFISDRQLGHINDNGTNDGGRPANDGPNPSFPGLLMALPFAPTGRNSDYLTYNPNASDQFYEVYAMKSASMYGPWDPPVLAGIFPQMQPDDGSCPTKNSGPPYGYDEDIWCYTPIQVLEFASSDDNLAFTYSTNSFSYSFGTSPAQPTNILYFDNAEYRPYFYPTCNPLFGTGCNLYGTQQASQTPGVAARPAGMMRKTVRSPVLRSKPAPKAAAAPSPGAAKVGMP